MSFIKDDITFTAEKEGYINHAELERKTRNHLELTYYQQIKPLKRKDSRKQEKKENAEKGIKPFHYPRSEKIASDHAKFNLHHLLTENPPSFVKLLTINLLQELYGHTSFFQEGSRLIDSFIQVVAPKNLIDLIPEDEALHLVYYKMLKGTNHYDLQKGIGYPPLDHFMTIDSSDHHVIHYADCHEVLLRVLFGRETSQEIIQSEASKYFEVSKYNYTLSHQELDPYIKKAYSSAPAKEQLLKYVDFSSKKGKRNILLEEDKGTHITIIRHLSR